MLRTQCIVLNTTLLCTGYGSDTKWILLFTMTYYDTKWRRQVLKGRMEPLFVLCYILSSASVNQICCNSLSFYSKRIVLQNLTLANFKAFLDGKFFFYFLFFARRGTAEHCFCFLPIPQGSPCLHQVPVVLDMS